MLFRNLESQLILFQELSSLVGSSVTLVESLQFLQTQNNVPRGIQRELAGVNRDVKAGSTLGDALKKHVSALADWQIGIITAAEKSGTLKAALHNITRILEQKKNLYYQIFQECLLPLFYIAILILISPTKELMGALIQRSPAHVQIYVFAVAKIVFVIAAVIAFFGLSPRLIKAAWYKRTLDNVFLYTPIIGGPLRKIALYRFLYIFVTCYGAGVHVLTAWSMAADGCGNETIAASLRSGSKVLREGGDIDTAFFVTKMFSDTTLGLVRTGVKSGTLKAQLEKCALLYEREQEIAWKVIVGLFPKLFFLIIAWQLLQIVMYLYSGYWDFLQGFGSGNDTIDQQLK